MFNLRKPKDQIVKSAKRLFEQVEQLETNTREKILPLIEQAEDQSNEVLLLRLLRAQQGESTVLSEGLRAARRALRMMKKEFEVLVASSLARSSLAEYQRRHRLFAASVGGTSAASFQILLNDFDNFREEIDHFVLEVDSSEDVVADTVATMIDVGIIVALAEEFRVLRSVLDLKEPERKNDRYYYPAELQVGRGGTLSVVATLIGEMGPTSTAVASSDFLRFYEPKIVAIVGIAGSLDKDLMLGDVVVAKGVDHYGASMKAVDIKDDFDIYAGGPILRPSPRIVQIAENVEFAHPDVYASWQHACQEFLKKAPTSHVEGVVRPKPFHRVEVVASGSTLSGSTEFNKWLRTSRNREIKCIEMESIGLALAAESMSAAEVLVVRGISDAADGHKGELEASSKNFYREYAMHNATQFLMTLLTLPELMAP